VRTVRRHCGSSNVSFSTSGQKIRRWRKPPNLER
jgi:hypothetical protein